MINIMGHVQAINPYAQSVAIDRPDFDTKVETNQDLDPRTTKTENVENWIKYVIDKPVNTQIPDCILSYGEGWIVLEVKGGLVHDEQEISQPISEEEDNRIVEAQIKKLFDEGKHEIFEDGKDTDFSNTLIRIIENHGNSAIGILSNEIFSGLVNIDVASETLRWIGRINHPKTHDSRFDLLTRSLLHNFPTIREGAIIGLDLMADRKAITFIENAIQKEELPILREDMKQVLVDLETI